MATELLLHLFENLPVLQLFFRQISWSRWKYFGIANSQCLTDPGFAIFFSEPVNCYYYFRSYTFQRGWKDLGNTFGVTNVSKQGKQETMPARIVQVPA